MVTSILDHLLLGTAESNLESSLHQVDAKKSSCGEGLDNAFYHSASVFLCAERQHEDEEWRDERQKVEE